MKLSCGIVGLPNVGKSTIFSALTRAKAEAANYPFCTIDPNVGMAELADERLDFLASTFNPKRKIPAVATFVDIAGLIKGASKGEGLGNKFLANIRETTVIAHVVRCFDDPDVQHVREDAKVEAAIDPVSDILAVDFELAQADLDAIERRCEKAQRQARALGKEEEKRLASYFQAVDKVKPLLFDGKRAAMAELTTDEREALSDLNLLTMKPEVFVCNVDEAALAAGGNDYTRAVQQVAEQQGSDAIIVCGKMEAELAEIDDEGDRRQLMEGLGVKESALSSLVRTVYHLMGLATFFTAGADECRAWTIMVGARAPEAAGVIHTDFQKGFIKAEAYSVDDLREYGSEAHIKEAGKIRQEGKDYVVQDGDVLFFKFNVAH